MEISIRGQAVAFLGALVLGGGLGLFYDLCRLVRGRLPGKTLGCLLDLLYWPAAVAVLFFWSVWAGDGVVRVYLMAGVVLGGALWFLTLSPWAVKLGNWLVDQAVKIGRVFLFPLRCAQRLWKNFRKNTKKDFPFWKKRFTITGTIDKVESQFHFLEGGGGHAVQTGGDPDQAGDHDSGGRRPGHHLPDAGSDRPGPGGAG